MSGASVHLVDEEYDHGRVLAPIEIPVAPANRSERLEQRVMALEGGLFVSTFQAIEAGTLAVPRS